MEYNVLFWARAIERFLIVGFGGVSLILGWNLFKVGITTKQEAEVKWGKWFIKLQKVGPGIFFALFGTFIFISSLTNPLHFEGLTSNKQNEQNKQNNQNKQIVKVRYIFEADPSKGKEFIKAVNTLRFLPTRLTGNPQFSDSVIKPIEESISILEVFKAKALEDIYEDDFSDYMDIKNRSGIDPNAVTNLKGKKKEKFYEIDQLYNDEFK